MKQIKLLMVASLLTSCTTSQLVYQTTSKNNSIEHKNSLDIGKIRAKKLESLGLREYTVITKDTTYYVQIPIDSVICHDTFDKYFKYNRE